MGYHKKEIKKGVYGEFSKIKEEVEEIEDAIEQKVTIMELVELSDLYGAIEGYIHKKFNLTMDDLSKMSTLTKKSFEDGTRLPRD